jgi:hypothetical protein
VVESMKLVEAAVAVIVSRTNQLEGARVLLV